MHISLPKLILSLALSLACFLYLSPAIAQVIFDSSFHNDGRATIQYNLNTTQAYSHAVLSDGSIMATGNEPASYYPGYMFRVQPDGSNSGTVTINNCMDKMVIHRMPGDTVIIAGQGWDATFNHQPANQQITVTKRGSTGQPITSFGNGGSISFYVPLGMSYWGGHPSAITVQPDGKIVVSITVNTVFPYSMVIRLLPNGQFDNTFGQGGVKEILLGACGYIINRIFPVDNNKLLFTGNYKTSGSTPHYSAFRLKPNGDYDSTYGTYGYAYTTVGFLEEVYGSAVEPDGKVVIAGSNGGGFNLYAAAIRYTANGVLDNSFGTGGIVNSASNFRYACAVERDSQGLFYVLGTYSPDQGQNWYWYLTRLNSNGATDATFNGNGIFAFSVPSTTHTDIRGLSLLPHGKILVYGDYRDANYNWNLYIGRLLTKPWVAAGGGVTSYCAGDTATLKYYGAGQPQWYKNGVVLPVTGNTIQVAASGTYHAVSQSSNDSSELVVLNFHPLPQPVIQRSGDSLVVTGGGSFLWYYAIDSTAIPGALGPIFQPAADGSFYVRQTDTNGCTGYSAIFQFSTAGIGNVQADGSIACWPNPTAGALHIRNGSPNAYELQISLVTGQVIARYQVAPGLQVIDLKQLALPAGSLLILQFSGEREQVIRKVFVQ